MAENGEKNQVDAFLRALVENVASNAANSAKLENITNLLTRQDGKIDGVGREVSEMRVEQRGFRQDVDGVKTSISDHEARIRELTARLALAEAQAARTAKLEGLIELHDARLDKLEQNVVRIVAIASAAIFVVQSLISLFIAPWVQSVLF